MSGLSIVVLSEQNVELARKIQTIVGGSLSGLETRVENCDQYISDLRDHLQSNFQQGNTIIGVMAAGALIRQLAPVLKDKFEEPPVLAISEDGRSVVPLLGGHHGANDLARTLSISLNGHAAVTTSGDLRFGIALDQPPENLHLVNPQDAKQVMAELLNGASATLNGESDWISNSSLPLENSGTVKLTITETSATPDELELVYHPKSLVLGLGCERGAEGSELIELSEKLLISRNLSVHSIDHVSSIDVKADEKAIHAVAEHLGVEARFYSAQALEAEAARLENPSDVVFAEVGCHGVAEGAALASVGPTGSLMVPKQKSKRATAALATGSDIGTQRSLSRGRGRLFVVGIGPGQEGWRSPEVTKMIKTATDLVGYSLYLDIIAPITAGQKRHDFDLGKEENRVRHAMELAGEGRDVALVCSGDAGIYAMATLVFELMAYGGLSDGASRIAIEVSPGISALQGAAARAGAPLGHDFCTISLSDLLTPWEAIQMRVKAAAQGDFVVAFYNPVSKRRRTQLAYARDVLLEHRPADTPVVLASNLGRSGEKVRIVPLAELDINDVDMLTVVVVGSSETKTVTTGDNRTWVYTPRGYSAKPGTKIQDMAAE